ncbi:fatty acyl-CoA reductase wat-like [Anoplolepis gracilipes]|uniref:fatty acyl-CoA reductase wat-like n=1 Tax=Anoplolepis gracilipes TaxID=354296 RepID=UPI003B9DFEB3
MKNLISLVYVSTAHLDNPFIEEKTYPPIADWRKMIKVAESLDEHILSIFTAKFTPQSTCFVVNCTLPNEKCILFREVCNIGFKVPEDIPLEGVLWTRSTLFAENLITYYALTILWHILPAIIIDSVLKLSGHKSMLLGLQKKIYVANRALEHFLFNEWKFDNTNSRDLMTLIPRNVFNRSF